MVLETIKTSYVTKIIMVQEERISERSGRYVQYDVIDKLDSVQLKPARIWEIFKPIFAFTIPGLGLAIVTGFFMVNVLMYILFASSLIFILTGIMFSITIAITRTSKDRHIYILTKDGLRIQSNKTEDRRIKWDEITDIELIGKGEGNRIKRICIIRTKGEEIVIQLNRFTETTEDTSNPDAMIDIIDLYYQDKKK